MKVKMKNEMGFLEEIETTSNRFLSLRKIQFLEEENERLKNTIDLVNQQATLLYEIARKEIIRRVNNPDLATLLLSQKLQRGVENGIQKTEQE